MIGLVRHVVLFALTVAGCLVVTLGAAWLGLRHAPFERVDTVTASSIGADYGSDARSELSPPLLLGIIEAAAQDDQALAEPRASGEPPRSASEPAASSTARPQGTATPPPDTVTPAPTPRDTPTVVPTPVGSPTVAPTPEDTPTKEPPPPSATPEPEPDTPTHTPTRIINLGCGPPILPGDLLDGINDVIRPTCTPTPTFTPKPSSTPTPKPEPTPTRTPILDLFPDDWPIVGPL